MITRVFRVRIKPDLCTVFEKEFQEKSTPLIASQAGLVSVHSVRTANTGSVRYGAVCLKTPSTVCGSGALNGVKEGGNFDG
jgi:hypothetical protein